MKSRIETQNPYSAFFDHNSQIGSGLPVFKGRLRGGGVLSSLFRIVPKGLVRKFAGYVGKRAVTAIGKHASSILDNGIKSTLKAIEDHTGQKIPNKTKKAQAMKKALGKKSYATKLTSQRGRRAPQKGSGKKRRSSKGRKKKKKRSGKGKKKGGKKRRKSQKGGGSVRFQKNLRNQVKSKDAFTHYKKT